MRSSKLRFLGAVFGPLTLAVVSLFAQSHAFGEAYENVLWNFNLNRTDGLSPQAGLIMDQSGNLFGTTQSGGAHDGGTVFELTPPSTVGGNWKQSTLWSFGNGADGANPRTAGLVMDKSGNLYGTTENGGPYGKSFRGYGTVFELTPPSTSHGNWVESNLWNFGNSNDGKEPEAGLIIDKNGNLYGTTSSGGAYGESPGLLGDGTVFELTPPLTSGGHWSESILWSFSNSADGDGPRGGLIIDKSGKIYGTTPFGGSHDGGTVFELTRPSTVGGNWKLSTLWSFGHGTDGRGPHAGLIMDKSGDLYSTTEKGGTHDEGTVFELSIVRRNWKRSILWNFADGLDGGQPSGGLFMDSRGNLYGTTSQGGDWRTTPDDGPPGKGAVFQLIPPSTRKGHWTESTLCTFGSGTDGAQPWAGLAMDKNGNLYGTTEQGGEHGWGTVFEISNIVASPTPAPTPTASPP